MQAFRPRFCGLHKRANPMTNYQKTVAAVLAALSAVSYVAAMPTESVTTNVGSSASFLRRGA